MNDEYLAYSCREVYLDGNVLETNEDPKQTFIAVDYGGLTPIWLLAVNTDSILTGFQLEFAIFVRPGKGTPLTYVSDGIASGAPSEIVKLVEEKAEAVAKKTRDIEKRDISTTMVYEVRL